MYTCRVCSFNDVLLDDVVLEIKTNIPGKFFCICLSCYSRETDNKKQMSKDLRRSLVEVLGAVT